jgi:N-acetylmuramoyl-L-alanine amidase
MPTTSEPLKPKTPPTIVFAKPKREVRTVFLHCSASDNPKHDNAATIRSWHVIRGFNDIGYHFFIRHDGTVEYGRGLEKVPAAQEGHNTGSIAICVSGNEKFTDESLQSCLKLCQQINSAYNGTVSFHGHREVNPHKRCPVFNYKLLLDIDENGLMRRK